MARLAVDGGDVWYEDRGGDGRPLVFLHGAWSNAEAWDRQVEQFEPDYRIVRTDLRGHGRTGPTDSRRYTVGLFADDLESLVGRLDLEEPILCGLSMGNIIVQEFLDRHPNRAAAAILAGPARSMPPIELPQTVKAYGPPPGIATSLSLAGSKVTFRSMVRSVRTAHGGPWLSVDPEVRSQAIEAAGEMSTDEYHKVFRALYAYDPPALSHVRTPTMAVYGKRESPLVKRQGRRAVDEVGDGPVVAVDDAAHLVNLDNPKGFETAVAEFLGATGLAG